MCCVIVIPAPQGNGPPTSEGRFKLLGAVTFAFGRPCLPVPLEQPSSHAAGDRPIVTGPRPTDRKKTAPAYPAGHIAYLSGSVVSLLSLWPYSVPPIRRVRHNRRDLSQLRTWAHYIEFHLRLRADTIWDAPAVAAVSI